jgi:hypothetical protein
MARDYLFIGPCPPEEEPLQVGKCSINEQKAECQRYIN